MLFKKKQVLCTDCGFFCWHIRHESGEGPYRFEEIRRRYRKEFQAANPDYKGIEMIPCDVYDAGAGDEEHKIYCLRGLWFWVPRHEGRPEYVGVDDIRKPRQCLYYIEYQPAYTPEEHKELKRQEVTNRAMIKASLMGAAIGAGTAIAAQLLYAYYVSNIGAG